MADIKVKSTLPTQARVKLAYAASELEAVLELIDEDECKYKISVLNIRVESDFWHITGCIVAYKPQRKDIWFVYGKFSDINYNLGIDYKKKIAHISRL